MRPQPAPAGASAGPCRHLPVCPLAPPASWLPGEGCTFPSTEWPAAPQRTAAEGAANGHLGKELGHQPSQPSKFTVIKHGILAKTARLHGRKKVPGNPRQRRPLPSRSHVAVWPHTRTTPARASCHRSQGHSFATAAPSGGGGGETEGAGATSRGGATGGGLSSLRRGAHDDPQARQRAVTCRRGPGRGALQQPRPS